jgi:hypothetical protein
MWQKLNLNGIPLPMAQDASKGPSFTLLCAYLAFILAVGCIIRLTVTDPLMGAASSILLFVVCAVLYRIRNLDKAKFDLDDKSFELSGDSNEPK